MAASGGATGAMVRSAARSLAERERAVLRGVVLIHMQIARHLQRDVDQRVARELLDHVVEKADPGGDRIGAGAVEIEQHQVGHVPLRIGGQRDEQLGVGKLAQDGGLTTPAANDDAGARAAA